MYILFFIFINIRFYLLAQILMLYFIRKIYVRGDIIDLGYICVIRANWNLLNTIDCSNINLG